MCLNKPFNIGQAVKAVESPKGCEMPLDNGFVADGFYDEKRGWILLIHDGSDRYERPFDKVIFE